MEFIRERHPDSAFTPLKYTSAEEGEMNVLPPDGAGRYCKAPLMWDSTTIAFTEAFSPRMIVYQIHTDTAMPSTLLP